MVSLMAALNVAAAAWVPALWRASWQGGLVIGLVWLLDRLLPRLAPDTRCWLWRLACLKLLLALAWSAPAQPPWAVPLLPASAGRVAVRASGRRGLAEPP